jgi:hypothetical protein
VVGCFIQKEQWLYMKHWTSVKSGLIPGRAGKIMCAASAALEFLRNAGEVEGKYLQDIG